MLRYIFFICLIIYYVLYLFGIEITWLKGLIDSYIDYEIKYFIYSTLIIILICVLSLIIYIIYFKCKKYFKDNKDTDK